MDPKEIEEFLESIDFPSDEELRETAHKYKPPQSWYDHEEEDLF